jgi:hypothetical protein
LVRMMTAVRPYIHLIMSAIFGRRLPAAVPASFRRLRGA